jgi:hypothetical protein
MPSNAGATLRNVGRRLFDPSTGELDLSAADSLLERTRRGATDLDMCSYRMQNITKLARVAGEIFVSYNRENFCAREMQMCTEAKLNESISSRKPSVKIHNQHRKY